jgi:hypothetical protein
MENTGKEIASSDLAPNSNTLSIAPISTPPTRFQSTPPVQSSSPALLTTPRTPTPAGHRALETPSNLDYSDSSEVEESSQRSTAPKQGSTLTKDETLRLFNIAWDLREDYNNGKKGFWTEVQKRLRLQIGRNYIWKSCKNKVAREVEDRQFYLSTYVTGRENEALSELDMAVDQWIEFLAEDSQQVEETNKKKTQKQLKDQAANLYRDALLKTIVKNKKKRGQEEHSTPSSSTVDSSDNNNNSDDDISLVGGASSRATKRGKKMANREEFIASMLERMVTNSEAITSSIAGEKNEAYYKLAARVEDMDNRVGNIDNKLQNIDQKMDALIQLFGGPKAT